ncbi:MAG TPA: DUF3108 domain-containing protein [Bacteroidetes bacterium]|nr:DUF3108 domain-containing protein [Bacteroidota bacterium]
MRNKIQFFAFAVFVFFSFVGLTGFAPAEPDGGSRDVKNDAFQAGEYLEYRVHYGSVTAGTAKMQVREKTEMINGRPCYHVVTQRVSSKTFSLFFRVNDRYETYIDQETLVPYKFKRKIQEGSFKHYSEVEFDQKAHKAYERKSGVDHIETYDVPPNIQDVVSAFYFARTMNYDNAKAGDITTFQNFIDRKVHDLDVKFIGREVIEVGGMKYKTVKLEPLVKEGGIFQHEGSLLLWISDDKNRIPVRVESGLVIGSIQVDLKKAKNLKHPFTARVR